MRRPTPLLAALAALLLLVWPVQAQTPTPDRTVLDMTVAVVPAAPTTLCPTFGPGRLVVTLKAAGEGQPKPVTFELYSVRNVDPSANMTTTVGAAEASLSAPLQGGLYCLSLTNNAPVNATTSIAELSNLRQDVALRMTIAAP